MEIIQEILDGLAKQGWTPADLARVSKLSHASISRILSGKQTNLTDSTKRKIRNALILGGGKVVKMDAEKLAEKHIKALEETIEELREDKRRLQHEVDWLKKVKGIGENHQKKESVNG